MAESIEMLIITPGRFRSIVKSLINHLEHSHFFMIEQDLKLIEVDGGDGYKMFSK